MTNQQKETQTKLTKGLLDLIALQLLNTQPMHGYQVITKIRKDYGIYFGPSTIYPLLNTLEKKGFINSQWNMDAERPRKIYHLTSTGKNMITYTEEALNLICKKMVHQTVTVANENDEKSGSKTKLACRNSFETISVQA
jgi:DNA-binding PadR family transcriptional regulator